MNRQSKKVAREHLEGKLHEARETLQSPDRLERFLDRLEGTMKVIPDENGWFAHVPDLASLVRDFADKKFMEIPAPTLFIIAAALSYLVSSYEAAPGGIPAAGHADAAAVVAVGWQLAELDMDRYLEWKEKAGRPFAD